MAMTAPGGGGTTKPGRRQPRRGSLVGRLNRTERRYECLAQAFPHAPPSLLIETAGRLRRARYRRGDIIVAEGEPAVFVASERGHDTVANAVLTAPGVWLLVAAVACSVWPWVLLRKVAISVDRPSPHSAVVSFTHGATPATGTTRPISRHPIVQWHHFAILPAFGPIWDS
jgi:hypothetical protein